MAYFRRPRHAARLRAHYGAKADARETGLHPEPLCEVILNGYYEDLPRPWGRCLPKRARREHARLRAARRASRDRMPLDSPPVVPVEPEPLSPFAEVFFRKLGLAANLAVAAEMRAAATGVTTVHAILY